MEEQTPLERGKKYQEEFNQIFEKVKNMSVEELGGSPDLEACGFPSALDQAYMEMLGENDRKKNVINTIKILHRLIVSCVIDEEKSLGSEPKFKNLYSEEEVYELKSKINELIEEL